MADHATFLLHCMAYAASENTHQKLVLDSQNFLTIVQSSTDFSSDLRVDMKLMSFHRIRMHYNSLGVLKQKFGK